jgi:ribosomal protein S18 acetylase RimI-like enzyme
MISQFEDPWCNPQTDYLLTLTASDQVAAIARVFLNPAPLHERNANLWVEIHPEYRQRGLESQLLTWSEARARQRLDEYPADLPRSLRVNTLDSLTDRVHLLEQHGYKPIRSWYRMRRDLREPIPEDKLPPDLVLQTYRPELSLALWEAFNDTFQDHWSFEPISVEDWQQFFIQSTSFRPELTFLAVDGENPEASIAGFSINFVREADNAREGVAEGMIAELGTRRAWRKRGVATALLCQSMRAFKAAGLNYAGLGVDTESPTGATRLYEALGFQVHKRSLTFAKAIV